jgi:tRNA 2-thiouridine synthesizing protein A
MEHVIDARGLNCPIPLLKARAALPTVGEGDCLVVLATDPEAPVDIGALAADERMHLTVERVGRGWRLTLRR